MKCLCKTCGNEFEYHRKRKNCLKCTPARRTFESEEERLIETRKRRVADVKRRRHKVKNMSLEYKGNKCCICGYDKCKDALDFHHLDPTKKDFGIGENGYTRAWEKIKQELDKCILVCANCHREIHAGIINTDGL